MRVKKWYWVCCPRCQKSVKHPHCALDTSVTISGSMVRLFYCSYSRGWATHCAGAPAGVGRGALTSPGLLHALWDLASWHWHWRGNVCSRVLCTHDAILRRIPRLARPSITASTWNAGQAWAELPWWADSCFCHQGLAEPCSQTMSSHSRTS